MQPFAGMDARRRPDTRIRNTDCLNPLRRYRLLRIVVTGGKEMTS